MPVPDLISFDADQTLFDLEKVVAQALDGVTDFLQPHLSSGITAAHLRQVRDDIAARYENQKIDMLALRAHSFRAVLADHGARDELVDQAMAIFTEIRFGTVYFYDGVEAGLAELAKITKLGLITNGNSDPEKAGIAHYFDHIVLGEKYPFKKPDHRLFEVLLHSAGISQTDRLMHVGDSLEHDVQGANGIGAISVWFNPDGLANDTGIEPDHTIKHFSELVDLVQR